MRAASAVLASLAVSALLACSGPPWKASTAKTGNDPATGLAPQTSGVVWQQSEEVSVTIENAYIDILNGKNALGDYVNTPDKALILVLKVSPISETKLLHIQPWDMESQSDPKKQAYLTDEFRNNYRQVRIQSPTRQFVFVADGELFHKNFLTASKANPALTFISFQVPIPAAKTLTLLLPRQNFDGSGGLTVNVPINAIKKN
jgi:hypothetical protein